MNPLLPQRGGGEFGDEMQVVVLAGGFGTRLRPWTNHLPKPLLPMLDKTLVERVVEALPSDLVDEVLIAAGYGIEQMREHFDSVQTPYKITIVEETEPLGTGGAIRNCRPHLRAETFCVMNGDLLSSVPVGQMLEFHKSQGGLATISLWEVEDPTRFGVCDIRDDGKVYQFQEKPTLEEACSNMINAGCYILEPEIWERMPDGPHSMERDVYTPIANEGLLNGFPFTGHFVDAGTCESFVAAVQVCISSGLAGRGTVAQDNWIGESSTISENASVSGSSIDSNSLVSCGSRVTDSVLLEESQIEANATVSGCLIGAGASVGEGVNLDSVIVDFGAVIPAGHQQIGGQFPAVL